MKKLVLTMLVVALAIPAMAVNVSLVDNEDGTGTIQLTIEGSDVVRGLAIIVDAGADSILAVTHDDADDVGVNGKFNVFMDAAYDAEATTPGSYNLDAPGSAVANPNQAGVLALPASVISICMGALDKNGGQLGAEAGVYDIATIDLEKAGAVTITADTLRGGIVGVQAVAATYPTGPQDITDYVAPPTECVNENAPFYADWVAFGKPDCWCYEKNCEGDVDGVSEGSAFLGIKWVFSSDLRVFLKAYGLAEPGGFNGGLGVLSIEDGAGICADYDHKVEGSAFLGLKRVFSDDLKVLLRNYGIAEPGGFNGGVGVPDCSKDWDGDQDDDYNFWLVP